MDTIELLWVKQDLNEFPFNSLVNDIAAIKMQIRESHKDDLHLEIDRYTQEQSVGFDQRLQIYSESILFNPIFAGLEKRLQRLEAV